MKAIKIALVIVLWGVPFSAWAEWGRTADDYIRLPFWGETQICPDGNGGCWAVGNDGAVRGDLTGIGVIHISHEGDTTWGEEIFQPFGDRPSHRATVINADNGDLIVAAEVLLGEGEGFDSVAFFMQRINLNREKLWGEEGVRVGFAIESLLKWPSADTYLIDGQLRLQLINGEGELLWDDGVGWWEIGNEQVVVTSDQCVISVGAVEPFPSVKIVKIDRHGEILWERIHSAVWGENMRGWRLSDLESDREGGVIFTNKYVRFADIDDSLRYFAISVMRIDSGGDSAWFRNLYERQLERNEWGNQIDPYPQCDVVINYAIPGPFFVAWMDNPTYQDNCFKVISLNVDGQPNWGEPIDGITSPIGYNRLVAVNSDDGICYVWCDVEDREDGGQRIQQWGQRISFDGERLWGDRGRAVQTRGVAQNFVISDGAGGAITLIQYVNFHTVQMINRDGEIGVVLPVGVEDDYSNDPALPGAFSVELYPNPVNSHFRIVFDAAVPNQAFAYNLFDGTGRSVRSGVIPNAGSFEGDLSQLSSGQYFLKLESGKFSVTKGFRLVR